MVLAHVVDLRDIGVPHSAAAQASTWKRRMCSGDARCVERIILTATMRSSAFCRAL